MHDRLLQPVRVVLQVFPPVGGHIQVYMVMFRFPLASIMRNYRQALHKERETALKRKLQRPALLAAGLTTQDGND